MRAEYHDDELAAIYELGRLYYEMGYFVAAERVFGGLMTVDKGRTPARLGIGLLKIERGQFEEAVPYLRAVIDDDYYALQGKVALCIAFIAQGEFRRAKSLLQQVEKDSLSEKPLEGNVKILWEALIERCNES